MIKIKEELLKKNKIILTNINNNNQSLNYLNNINNINNIKYYKMDKITFLSQKFNLSSSSKIFDNEDILKLIIYSLKYNCYDEMLFISSFVEIEFDMKNLIIANDDKQIFKENQNNFYLLFIKNKNSFVDILINIMNKFNNIINMQNIDNNLIEYNINVNNIRKIITKKNIKFENIELEKIEFDNIKKYYTKKENIEKNILTNWCHTNFIEFNSFYKIFKFYKKIKYSFSSYSNEDILNKILNENIEFNIIPSSNINENIIKCFLHIFPNIGYIHNNVFFEFDNQKYNLNYNKLNIININDSCYVSYIKKNIIPNKISNENKNDNENENENEVNFIGLNKINENIISIILPHYYNFNFLYDNIKCSFYNKLLFSIINNNLLINSLISDDNLYTHMKIIN